MNGVRKTIGGIFVGTLLGASACATPPPANPPAEETKAGPAEEQLTVAEAPPAIACEAYDFQVCTRACTSRECLDWCAGTSCLELAASLHSCAAPGESKWLDAHPEPELVMLPPGPDVSEEEDAYYEMVDPESEEAYYRWETERDRAMESHWRKACVPQCTAGLGSHDPGEPGSVCLAIEDSAYRWDRYLPPPEVEARPEDGPMIAQAKSFGILGALSSDVGMYGGLMGAYGGSSVYLDMKATGDFEHRYALSQLVRNSDVEANLAECVPGMTQDDKAKSFKVVLRFDVSGEVESAAPQQDSSEAECVADRLAGHIRLPKPALRGLPTVQVDVRVRPEVDMSDVWGGLTGAEIGEAYGAGGLGLVGTGRGGGGTGEGTIGIGSIHQGGGGQGGGGRAGAAGFGGSSSTSAKKKPKKK